MNLCLIARGTAIELHNTKHETSCALTIAKALVDEFGDLSALRAKLIEDESKLSQQAFLSTLQNSNPADNIRRNISHKAATRKKGGWIAFFVFIAVIILIAITNGGSKKPSSSSTTTYNRSSSSVSNTKKTEKATAKPTAINEKEYSSSCAVGDYVYTNITLVEPEYGIYSENQSSVLLKKWYHRYVCKCTTDSGNAVWVCFRAADYQSNIDSTIDSYVDQKASEFSGDRVRFSPAAKLHGKIITAESVPTGLKSKIGQSTIIEYTSIDIPAQAINKKTTVSIKAIFPSYPLTSGTSNTITHILCNYTDSLGEKDWLYISASEYQKYFDSTANSKSSSYNTGKTFTTAKKVTVKTAYADDYINGASSTIGQETMYIFSGIN